MQALKRFIEREMIAELSRDGILYNLPDWVWDAVFDLFTIE